MKKTLVLLLLPIIIFFLFSCKSSKTTTTQTKPPQRTKVEKVKPDPILHKQVEQRNQKINIPLTEKDNSFLYAVVEKWLGTPHTIGGCSLQGIDCSCFVKNVYQEVYGIDLYRSSIDMLKNITTIERGKLIEGDILFFKIKSDNVTHVGIYLKDGFFAHASTSRGVVIEKLSDDYWSKYFYVGGRHKNVKTKYNE